ncbi:MAG: hypothetical protein EBS53_14985 [Bacteroidetes bacterium]|nr:hypothetical protein [Bacteroidota bacterium]
MKTKTAQVFLFSFFLCLVIIGQNLSATTVAVSQTNISLFSAPGVAVSVNTAAKFGYFLGGFTPTLNNITSWDENFRGFNGFWQSSTKRFSVSMALGDNNVGGGTQTGVTGFGVTNAVGSQLYLIGSTTAYNSSTHTNSTLNADYVGATTSTPVFILTDTSWIMPTTTALDTSTTTFGFTANTGLAVFGGVAMGNSFSFNPATQTGSLTMTTIPEPSSISLSILGLVSALIASRRNVSKKGV